MRPILTRAPLLLLFVVVVGCGPRTDPGPPNMMPNVLGALQIADVRERNAALATACRESAENGSGPAVLMGIPRIEDGDLRDALAEECARALSEGGQAEAALEVAKLISAQGRRDELLAELAE